MGMYASSEFSTGAFNVLVTGVDTIYVCTTQPASASSAHDNAIAKSTFSSGDFTVGVGDVSGYKVTLASKSNLTVTTSGDADHIVLCGASSSLYYITTCNSKSLTTSDTVTIPAWDIEIRDPAS